MTNWINSARKYSTTLSSIRGSLTDGDITIEQALSWIEEIRTKAKAKSDKCNPDGKATLGFQQVIIDSQRLENSIRNIRTAYIS